MQRLSKVYTPLEHFHICSYKLQGIPLPNSLSLERSCAQVGKSVDKTVTSSPHGRVARKRPYKVATIHSECVWMKTLENEN